MRRSYWPITIAVAFATFALAGCLERKEKITIHADGSAEITATFRGDQSDLTTGDALPTDASGWKTRETRETDKDGNEKVTREAALRIPAGGEWPAGFAPQGSAASEIALEFPTGLMIETRPDGAYYHFRRVYQARPHARFEYAREDLQKKLDEIAGTEPEQLTPQQRQTLVDALRQFEAVKQTEFVLSAARAMDDWPQDRVLKARQVVADYFAHIDTQRVAEKLGEPASEARDRAIQEFAEDMIGGVKNVLIQEMQSRGAGTVEQERMLAAYDREATKHEISEDIGDDFFEITIVMPGEVIAHNGDATEDGAIKWQFPGKALMDRDQEVMVTSRVKK
ncbi:MAG: hypothetical protein JNG88_02930 [Phycisphaerales bacterium]|nr:hypothetical protein [Phycisphaerales bacterium]